MNNFPCDLVRFHHSLQKTTPRGGTALKEGLQLVKLSIAPAFRNHAKRVLFIFTDGKHNTQDPKALAKDLKDDPEGMRKFSSQCMREKY